jgi:ribosomal RNA-processing protein 12
MVYNRWLFTPWSLIDAQGRPTARARILAPTSSPNAPTILQTRTMEDALSKIRPHTTSSLAHQKAPATLLRAIEATLDEQGAERTPTAYFATLLTTLDGTLKQGAPSLGEGELLPAELYLLSLVAAHVPAPVVRAQLPTVLGLTAPLFPALSAHAPVLRSQLGVYAAVFIALERAELEAPGVRQAFASALALVTDSRPKVRRRAAELVRDVLAEPPPPMSRHPYADRVGEWAATGLADAAASPVGKHKGKKTAEGDATDSAIHLLALLRMIMMTLPPSVSPVSRTRTLVS